MLDQSSQIIITGGQFNHNTPAPEAQNHDGTDVLLQHCALAALLDSSERMDPARCHPNTRDAVIKDIVAWIEDSNPAPSMMIMHGPAGTGKSALAQSIAERYKIQDWLAAAFFFSRTAPGRNNGHSLIPTIAYQLILSHPEVRPPIRMRLWKDPTLLKKSIQVVMEDLLIAPFFSWIFIVLCWITWAFGWVHPRLIVIDGLDECADNEIQSHILRAAATATRRLQRPFRILITCRPEQHIMQTLLEPSIEYAELDLGKRNASHDIQLFLSDKFEALKRDHPLSKHNRFPPSWPGSDIIANITENASGQFIYASVIMAYIGSTKHSPVDRLNIILGSSPKPDGDKPFAALDSLYTHIFASVDENLLMRQILGFMAIPRRADDNLGEYTTPAMISKLLSPVSIDSIFLVLEHLRSVISSAGPDEPIKFWHASISDFLLDEARSKAFFVDIQPAHEALARVYFHLFRGEEPALFLKSPFFHPFVEHYKRSLSERIQQELIAYNFFSAYKAAIGEPVTLQKLRDAWDSDIVLNLFHALAPCPNIVDVYVNGVYRNFPLEPCVKESLRLFIDSKKCKKNEVALSHALYVPLLHDFLNGDPTDVVISFAEQSAIGILLAQSGLTRSLPSWAQWRPNPLLLPQPNLLANSEIFPPVSFTSAVHDCSLILLPHASHYSMELVNSVFEQQGEPHIEIQPHRDIPAEVKAFLEEYRASKRRHAQ